jgi:hypothetical protein
MMCHLSVLVKSVSHIVNKTKFVVRLLANRLAIYIIETIVFALFV